MTAATEAPEIDAHLHLWDLSRSGYGWITPPDQQQGGAGRGGQEGHRWASSGGPSRYSSPAVRPPTSHHPRPGPLDLT